MFILLRCERVIRLGMVEYVVFGCLLLACIIGCGQNDNPGKRNIDRSQSRNSTPSPLPEAPSARLSKTPDLGDRLTDLPKSRYLLCVSSGQLAPAYIAKWDGITYTVAVSETTKTVLFISTSSDAFHTPEGFSMSNKMGDLVARYPGGKREERGWGEYVLLPSGWAAFARSDRLSPFSSLGIKAFFKRERGEREKGENHHN